MKSRKRVIDYLDEYPKTSEDKTNLDYFKRLSKLSGLAESSFKRDYYSRLQIISETNQIDYSRVKHGWYKTDEVSLFFKNDQFEEKLDLEDIDWDKIVKPTIKRTKPILKPKSGKFDRFVYTDVHIGMNPNPNGIGLYFQEWNQEELMNRLFDCIDIIKRRQKSNVLIIDDLGDLMDGWEGKTLRKQHDLPQNLTNQEAFDVGLTFKVMMIEHLSNYYDQIICHNVVNDNHSGDFGYIVNSAAKAYIEKVFPHVQFEIYKKFIEHYEYGEYIFMLSHGKDTENRQRGFKPHLDKDSKEFIENYINIHKIGLKDSKVEFSKGDSHQRLYDKSSSARFDYMNYPSFAPPSNWVMTNFPNGKSGAFFCNYSKDGIEPFDIEF